MYSFLPFAFSFSSRFSRFQKAFVMSKRNPRFRTARSAPVRKRPFALARRKESVELLPSPIKSESDKKLYRVIKLQNGLRALLVSDPTPVSRSDSVSSPEVSSESESEDSGGSSDSESSVMSADSDSAPVKTSTVDEEKLAACSLCVGVGSFSDPKEIQGLAHFVEHMVFMGSEKYPKENDFDSFIKKKGGSDNAQTDCETTSFHLEIPEKYLPQALDRFTQFFVSPLMKKDAMQREREAIESEFSLAIPSNTNRQDQLLASLFPPGHPTTTFTWGNLRSLKELVESDETLHKAAHDFRMRHYSAHRMTVALQARLSLDTLQQYVVDTFGQIPSNDLPPDNLTAFEYSKQLITSEFSGAYLMKPVGDKSEVHLTWIMPTLIPKYESKPDEYISYLLGHEGEGSLLSYLQKKVWALGIKTGNSGSGIDYTTLYSLFSIQIVLTQDGLDNIEKVIEAAFSYISLLRQTGPSERIFDEIRLIEEMNFRFEEEQQPLDYVETLAESMQLYPPEHYITGDKIYYNYSTEAITDLMELLTPDTVNILVVSNKHRQTVEYDRKEEWFGTEYKKMDLPAEWLKRWREVKPYDAFHLPTENPYITTDFNLIPTPKEYLQVAEKYNVDLSRASTKELFKIDSQLNIDMILKENGYEENVKGFKLDRPNLLRKNKAMEVWYKTDFKFGLPTAVLYFYFITPFSSKSAKDSCLLELWADVMRHRLREPLYPADMASLSHELHAGDRGILLKLHGYSQKLHLLLDVITAEMRSCCDSLTQSLFEAVRDIRRQVYRNALIKPSKLAKDIRMELMLEPYVSLRQKAEVIDSVTREDLQEYSRRLLENLYMQVLVEGNVPWYEAIRISESVHGSINFKPLAEEPTNISVREIPLGVNTLRVASFHQDNANSVITNYYQSGFTNDKETAIIEVLMLQMEEPLFDRLRTKEQLGYSVFNMMRYTFGVLGYSITVNSQEDKNSASHVDDRIEAFMKKFARDIEKLTEKAFGATKQALIQLKHSADVELREDASRNWREIVSQEYVFRRPYVEAEAIERLKLSEVKEWFAKHTLYGSKANLRKLSVQVVGHKGNASETSAPEIKDYNLRYIMEENSGGKSENFMNSIENFKKNLPFYPSIEKKLEDC